MFKPLPKLGDSGAWTSNGMVSEEDVRNSLAETKRLYSIYEQKLESATAEYSERSHVSFSEKHVADLARIQVILLSAMFLEGAVNAWGVKVVGEDFFKTHIERMKIESKVAILLALSGNGCIPNNHDSLKALRSLFDRRNQLVHRKTKEIKFPPSEAQFQSNNAEYDLSLCESGINKFRKLISHLDYFSFLQMGFLSEDEAL